MANGGPIARHKWPVIWAGLSLAAFGVLGLVTTAAFQNGLPSFAWDLTQSLFGWGPATVAAQAGFGGLGLLIEKAPAATLVHPVLAVASIALWLGGWAVVALGIGRAAPVVEEPSAAAGAPLHAPLARYRDFYGSTFLAYGGGMWLAETVLIALQTLLAGSGGATEGKHFGLPPVVAFGVSLLVACAIVFVAGFVGAARAGRLSAPEATIGVIYLGMPIPVALTGISFFPSLQLAFSYRLREILYLASMLGRVPELGYWLVFALLVLVLVLGITTGFVATSSGRVDIRAGYELFVAERHVKVFRDGFWWELWQLFAVAPLSIAGLALARLARSIFRKEGEFRIGRLVMLFFVLALGIIPPLIIYFIVSSAAQAVERTRIRSLGLKDPLKASEALNDARAREQSPTEMMTMLSVGGVGVGVMALIVVLSVMSGFEADLQKKILGTNADVIVMKYSEGFPEYPEVMDKVKNVPGVIGETPFILNEVMIASEGNITGTIIKGIDPKTVGSVTDLPKNILPGGSIDYLEHPEQIPETPDTSSGAGPLGKEGREEAGTSPAPDEDSMIDTRNLKNKETGATGMPGIVIGKELAASLKVVVGDRVNVVTLAGGELGPQGPLPKTRPFRVAGIFYSGMYEYDSKFVYIRLDQAQKFFNIEGATGIELKVNDVDDARRISAAVLRKLDNYPYRTKDWGELNKNLFSALRLEKLVMGLILSIIVIVAAGLIVATVIMLVLEKRKEISVLKALGVPDGGIVKIFLAEGLQIGIAGGLLGLFAGLVWCWLIERVGIKLDPEVYYIPSLPVKIEPLQTALSVLIAILVTYLGSIYPALKASRVEPVEGLKAE